MSDDLDELARLRRSAFGPTATAEERAAAEAALLRLDERARESASTVADVPGVNAPKSEVPSQTDSQATEFESADVGQDAQSSLWQRSIRVGWFVPIAIGSLLLGAVGAMSVTGQFNTTGVTVAQTPQPSSSSVAAGGPGTLIVGPGNLAAANSWFNFPPTSADAFPLTVLLHQIGVDQSQVRIVLNDGGQKLWAAKKGTTGFCLGIYDNSADGSFFNCATIQEFGKSGVSIRTTDFGAWWGGQGVTTIRRTPIN